MHFKSLRHVRDHVKVQGRAYDLLMYIALHTHMHTGEAFELTIERQALRHQLTPEWTRILLNGVIATGELVVERSSGRHPNRYRFPLERCHACQGDDLNPEVELGVEINPKVPPPQPQTQPQTPAPSTPKSDLVNPKVMEASTPRAEPIGLQKEVKELKDLKEGSTPNCDHDHMDHQQDAPAAPIAFARERKLEEDSPYWCAACRVAIPTCPHRVLEVVRSTPTGAVLRGSLGGGQAGPHPKIP